MIDTSMLPFSEDPAATAARDPLELQRWFNLLAEKQDLANSNTDDMAEAERQPELSAEECRFAILLTRILRRTNTGPAKSKTSRAKKTSSKETTQAALDEMFKNL